MLDLYQGRWEGKPLHPGEFVIRAEEPSIQARGRNHVTLASRSRGQRVERLQRRWPNLVSSTCPCTPTGSTRSRSTTRSSAARLARAQRLRNLAALARTLNAFERHWNEIAEPFEWDRARRPS